MSADAPSPDGPWVMAQGWHDLLFAHWPVPAEVVAATLPAGLELDTHEGRAWLGVIPFRMSGVRLRGLPPCPGTGAFPELNVRTYVTHHGRPGVWFYSLDAASRVAVAVARLWFGLPYFRAEMHCRPAPEGGIAYDARRTHRGAPAAEFRARYAPAGPPVPAPPGSLDHFLVERYSLFARTPGGRLLRGDIAHAPWPLQPATAQLEVNTMAAAAGFALPDEPPRLHFVRRLDVRIGRPRHLAR